MMSANGDPTSGWNCPAGAGVDHHTVVPENYDRDGDGRETATRGSSPSR